MMEKHDPQAFEDLFNSEPEQASPLEIAKWVNLYDALVALLQRQLDETRDFAARVPASMRKYLRRENEAILTEELEIFQRRLSHWRARATSQASLGIDAIP